MKLSHDNSPAKISGSIGGPSNFNIAATPEAFRILSSGLYTNKIRAIIRELSCNAYDAHVAANRADEPFEVHLPTSFEPFFSIKDHGTGLEYISGGCQVCKGTGHLRAKNEVEEEIEIECRDCNGSGDYDAVLVLYTTYFGTNKSNSNLFVGALGLGSKSPLCYTEGFSVTNVYNGVTRIYSCFFNQQGIPTTVLQTEEETIGKANGVEIQFPVKQTDIWEFENQAKYVWEFFNPLPNHNVSHLRVNSFDYIIRTENWGLRRAGASHPRAIQGMVQYSIGDIDSSKLTSDQLSLIGLRLDLFFPIGELAVAASRESLSNDERTVGNILARLSSIKEQLLADTKAKIMACTSYWEARLLIYSLSNQDGIGPMISKAFQSGEFATLNPSFALTSKDLTVRRDDYPGLMIKEFSSTSQDRPMARLSILLDGEKRRYVKIQPQTDEVFVINDVGFGTDKFLHWMMQHDKQNEWNSAYLLTKMDKETTDQQVEESSLKLIDFLGGPPVILMSELKEKYQDEMKQNKPKTSVYIPRTLLVMNEGAYIPANTIGWGRIWETHKGELPTGVKIYLPLKSLEPQVGNFHTAKGLDSYISSLRIVEPILGSNRIYGVPTWYTAKLDESWVELSKYVDTKIREILTKDVKLQLEFYRQNFDSGMNSTLSKISKKKLLPTTSPLRQFCDQWYAAKQMNRPFVGGLNMVLQNVRHASLMVLAKQDVPNFSKLWDKVLEKYTLLSWLAATRVDPGTEPKFVADVVEYINHTEMLWQDQLNIVDLAQPQTVQTEENIHVN